MIHICLKDSCRWFKTKKRNFLDPIPEPKIRDELIATRAVATQIYC